VALPPFDVHAAEQALRIVEGRRRGEIVVVSIATPETLGAIREALALGRRRVILSDPALAACDVPVIGRALAALLARE
jgi:electron transfer flavoprotein alpha/beta subunit